MWRASDEADIAAAPLVADLAKVGVRVDSLWDLVNKEFEYHAAIPVLVDWLGRTENVRVQDAIVRALTVKFASPAAVQALFHEFEYGEPLHRWTVGNALGVAADKAWLGGLLRLATERDYGKDRQMIVSSLWRFREPRVVATLIDLLKDDDVAGHALVALRRMNAREARSAIEPFANHPRAWWRREAKKALAKFDKAS